jgi:CRP/FNR family cyclic AMP-dependent transcriptional regulator
MARTVGRRWPRTLYHAILPAMTDLAALAAVPLFTDLDQARLEGLAARSVVRTVEAGRIVALRGRPATHLIVVEHGALTASLSTAGGRRLRLGRFPAPCAVDKAAVLDGGGHTATWTTATRSRLRLVPAADLLAIVDDVPAARRHVLAHLARTVRDQQDDLVRAHVADVTTRTAAWLLRAAGQSATTTVRLPGAQEGLAEAIGATRVSVNRALRSLTAEGVIRVGPGAVTILAPELLAHRADHDKAT